MPVNIQCSSCGKRYSTPDSLLGKTTKCSACGQTIKVAVPAAPVASAASPSTAVDCGNCHEGFAAAQELWGKQVKCPKCGSVISIPNPQARFQVTDAASPPPLIMAEAARRKPKQINAIIVACIACGTVMILCCTGSFVWFAAHSLGLFSDPVTSWLAENAGDYKITKRYSAVPMSKCKNWNSLTAGFGTLDYQVVAASTEKGWESNSDSKAFVHRVKYKAGNGRVLDYCFIVEDGKVTERIPSESIRFPGESIDDWKQRLKSGN